MQLFKNILLFTIITSLSQLGIAQQNFSYKAILDTNHILIGDHVAMRILVSQSPKMKVGFPIYSDSLVSGVEVLADVPVDTVNKENGQVSLVKTYVLTSFDTGSYTIPNIKLLLLIQGAKPDTISLEKLVLHVATVVVDTSKSEFKDIKPPIKAPLTFGEVAPWFFGGLGVIALIGLIVWLVIRGMQNKPLLSMIKPDEPADIMAFRLLAELKNKKLWQNGHLKQYHSELTEILRVYIYREFGINALEQTSDEILQSMMMQKLLTPDMIDSLRTVFTVADLTKFAKYNPVPEENETSIRLSEQFVEKTKHEPEPVNVEKPNDRDASQINSSI
jgi:hypothetical protein